MRLQQFNIYNYRNLSEVELNFDPYFNIVNGQNGMGKTNLLDAIYYLAMTKSYFVTGDTHTLKYDQDFFRLDGLFFSKAQEKVQIVSKFQKSKGKVFEKNHVKYDRLIDHIGVIPIVMMAPKDQQLIYEGSKARRAFIDSTLSQMDKSYLEALLLYNHHLKQRNAYLKSLDYSNRLDQSLLNIYNEKLIESSTVVFKKRALIIPSFASNIQYFYNLIAKNDEQISLHYRSALSTQSMEDVLEMNQPKDVLLKRTTSGIHTDDIIFKFSGKLLKNMASQGQQKSFILALKLAQFRLLSAQMDGETPIILLDDIFDKLDHKRVFQLLELLKQEKMGQIFISDTEPNRLYHHFETLETSYKQFLVEDGQITAHTHEET